MNNSTPEKPFDWLHKKLLALNDDEALVIDKLTGLLLMSSYFSYRENQNFFERKYWEQKKQIEKLNLLLKRKSLWESLKLWKWNKKTNV